MRCHRGGGGDEGGASAPLEYVGRGWANSGTVGLGKGKGRQKRHSPV